jgi:hypothetical protein
MHKPFATRLSAAIRQAQMKLFLQIAGLVRLSYLRRFPIDRLSKAT